MTPLQAIGFLRSCIRSGERLDADDDKTIDAVLEGLRNPEKQVRVGVAVFIERDDKVLLGMRKGSHGAGTWCVPGGHVDFGEDPEATCVRETLEESGLAIHNVKIYRPLPYVHTHFREDEKQYITLYFTADCPEGDPKIMEPDKCSAWAWFDKTGLPSPLFEPLAQSNVMDTLRMEADENFLQNLYDRISGGDPCNLDHSGSCHAHDYFGEGECIARRLGRRLGKESA